ncbi:MAG: OmpP1/FadL family transporter, partial [Desulfovibrionales bacterium]
MLRRVALFGWVLIFLLVSSPVWSAGFGIYEWGARGLALGGTLVARADDPSAIAFNPAGITQLEGVQTQFGVTAIAPEVDVTTTRDGNTVTESGKDNLWYPPHAYLSWQLSDRYWLGLGAFT